MTTHFDHLKATDGKKTGICLKTKMVDGRWQDKSAVDILKATQQGTEPVRCECQWGAYWHNLAKTIEPSVCGGHAALCQITLTTCYYYYMIT